MDALWQGPPIRVWKLRSAFGRPGQRGADALKIPVVKNILEANERIAQENRKLFEKEKVVVINLMSSPGSGKTSLLERTTLSKEPGSSPILL
jgi:hypothetical protein